MWHGISFLDTTVNRAGRRSTMPIGGRCTGAGIGIAVGGLSLWY